MDKETKVCIARNIERLESTSPKVERRDAESLLMEILASLLAEDGYTATRPPMEPYQSNRIGFSRSTSLVTVLFRLMPFAKFLVLPRYRD
jgi:hypothetical protein